MFGREFDEHDEHDEGRHREAEFLQDMSVEIGCDYGTEDPELDPEILEEVFSQPDVPGLIDVQEPPVVRRQPDLSEPEGFAADEAPIPNKLRSIRDHLAEILEDLGRRAGRISRPVVITGLAVAVGAPVVAAAFSAIGPAAAAFLNQVGAFGAGYLTEKVANWLQQDPKAKSTHTDEDTVRRVLTRMMQDTASESSMAPQHLAALLADPVLLGAILTVARTKGSELLRYRPGSQANDDDWLYEEVVEALEELALTPTFLESALRQAFRELAGSNR